MQNCANAVISALRLWASDIQHMVAREKISNGIDTNYKTKMHYSIRHTTNFLYKLESIAVYLSTRVVKVLHLKLLGISTLNK
jgi:hypothetical protein